MEFKVVTWNVNSITMRINHLIEFIKQHDPDVICLQELKCETVKFPYAALSHLPYNLYINGQKSYNGVAILSKIPADEVKIDFTNNPVPDQARFIEICFNSFMGFTRVISLYAPNGGVVGSDKFQMKLEFYDQFTKYIKYLSSYDEKLEYSWWDYRAGAFKQNKGMRIDSVVSSVNTLPFLQNCFIDYNTREQNKPSDHAPVIAIYRPYIVN